MAWVYAIASAKGGVGKTTTAANLGAALAAADYRVALVDCDLGMANLGGILGIEPSDSTERDGPSDAASATLHDALAGEASVADATYEGPHGLAVVPGATALAAYPEVEREGLRDVVESFAEYDYVLLDTGAGLSHDTALPLGIADEALLVSTTDPNALRDTAKTREIAERLGTDVAGAVLVGVDPGATDADVGEIAAELDAEVLAAIPDDAAIDAAVAAGDPLTVHAPDSEAAAAFRALAGELVGEPVPAAAAETPAEEAPAEADVAAEDDEAPDEATGVSETEGRDAEARPEELDADPSQADATAAGSASEVPADSASESADDPEPPSPSADSSESTDTTEDGAAEAVDDDPADPTEDESVTVPDAESGVAEDVTVEELPADDADVEATPHVEDAEAAAEGGEGGTDEADGDGEEEKGFFRRLLG